ncbi:hypothetical protein Agabi119p4_10677 [Agaricus bisporus var. burnettii]|uniref:Uncharacterized protein n=1 Tax=Agaricus bisporus var. burnettii TaxID=192524 RepID=A0A8H7C3B7_AGABI|nr:hypothetical protein Agabi119p4_10677 [Agaricus bisporus var. burnettii]
MLEMMEKALEMGKVVGKGKKRQKSGTRKTLFNLSRTHSTTSAISQCLPYHQNVVATHLNPMDMRSNSLNLAAADRLFSEGGGRPCRIPPEPHHTGFLLDMRLKDLEFGHLDWKEMSPAHTHCGKKGKYSEKVRMIHRPCSSAELTVFVSDLKSLQEGSQELEVTIIGGVPKERVAVFKRPLKEGAEIIWDFMYYAIPYPE